MQKYRDFACVKFAWGDETKFCLVLLSSTFSDFIEPPKNPIFFFAHIVAEFGKKVKEVAWLSPQITHFNSP